MWTILQEGGIRGNWPCNHAIESQPNSVPLIAILLKRCANPVPAITIPLTERRSPLAACRSVSDEQAILLSTLPADTGQRKAALSVALLSLAIAVAPLPFGNPQLPQSSAFILVVATITFVVDLVTATLLFAQFLIFGSVALAALATGYVVTGLIMLPYALTFPGAFSSSGLLGASLDSPVWIFLCWHALPATTTIGYVALKRSSSTLALPPRLLRRVVFGCVLAAIALVCGLTWLVTAEHRLLPAIMLNMSRGGPAWHTAAAFLLAYDLVAFSILWRSQGSVLDLWLLVQSWSWLLECILLNFAVTRFDLLYYAARIFWVTSSGLVMLVLISQLSILNTRLVLSTMAQRRSRDEHIATLEVFSTAMAHELRQPLTAATAVVGAAANWLEKAPPDVNRAQNCLGEVVSALDCLSQTIEAVQGMFRRDEKVDRKRFDINELLREIVALLRRDIEGLQIGVQFDLDVRIPVIQAYRAQIGLVVLNLVKNSADALSHVLDRPRVLLITSQLHDAEEVKVAIVDSGAGLDPESAERIFDVFYTNKPDGMGMGLFISRLIIRAHGGRLWAAPNETGPGAVFAFTLPLLRQTDHENAGFSSTDALRRPPPLIGSENRQRASNQ
jgi:signal transduction histidine kinase